MKSVLINALETICPGNVYLQGTLAPDAAYPDSFITFWTNSADDDAFFDDSEKRVLWNYTVIFYSSDPALVSSKPGEIRTALKNAGFIPQGRGMDIPSDVHTHTGWAMTFIYPQNI